jgi:AraC-like DNA-binding protein
MPDQRVPSSDHPSTYWFDPAVGRTLQEYQIIYITKGEGTFHSASMARRQVGAGNTLFLFPGEWHSYWPKRRSGWEAYWIGFNGPNMEGLAKHFFSERQAVLDIGFNEQLISLYEQGIDIAHYQKAAFQPMLAGIAQCLLSTVYYSDRNNSFRDKEIITKIDHARMMMHNHAPRTMDPEEIARQLNMSYSWFRRVFKQYTGFSPVQYQMEIRIQRAKELLTGTAYAVKEIAYELNFESFSHFVALFRQKTGMTPGAYRDSVRGGKGAGSVRSGQDL